MTCNQCYWIKIEEVPLIGWFGADCGKKILFQCKNCGKLLKIKMDNNPD